MKSDDPYVKGLSYSHWRHSRHQAAMDRIRAIFAGKSLDLLPFDEVRQHLHLRQKYYTGVQDIEVQRIKGSVGRYQDFTRNFAARSEDQRDRWQRVYGAAYATGVPSIEVYQVGGIYFVLDGNHRVSIARANDDKVIQAHVWEFPTSADLDVDTELDDVLIQAEYLDFLEITELDRSRPDHDIKLTAPGAYRELLQQISLLKDMTERHTGQQISCAEAATEWYDTVYLLSIQEIKENKLLKMFPKRTDADLLVWLWRQHKQIKHTQELMQVATSVADASVTGMIARFWQRVARRFKWRQ